MKLPTYSQNHRTRYARFLKGIFLMPAFLLCFLANAQQFSGWPNNSGPPQLHEDGTTETVDATNSPWYADKNRVRVTAAVQKTSSPDRYELTVSGSSLCNTGVIDLPVGKWCLLIQMADKNGTNVGKNCRVEVVTWTCGTGKLLVEVPTSTGNGWPALTFDNDSRVQLIRVPVWREVNLDPKGEITCHPYDHATGTGGVLALVVGSMLNFNGGIINASAKGYHVGGTYTLGQGGSGKLAARNWISGPGGWSYGPYPYALLPIPGGSLAPDRSMNPLLNGYLCSNNPNANANIDFDITGQFPTNNAQNGGVANNLVNAPSPTIGTIEHYDPGTTPANSSAWTIMRMGNAGDPGESGGTGAGGGGYGGTGGGNVRFPLGGQPGSSGYNGEAGGIAGDAARGGGVVLLKIYNFSKASTIGPNTKMIFADGENGRYGTNGGVGGEGGAGGQGADGNCDLNKIVPPGSIGGYGESGIGGGGGEGGDGGNCGTIWLMKKTTSALSSHVSLRGGNGGAGGGGGYSTSYISLPLANNWASPLASLPCNNWPYSVCNPDYTCPDIEICDCDKVFENLSNIKDNFTVTNSSWPRSLSKSGFPTVYYHNNYNSSGRPALYYTDYSLACPKTYKCMMSWKADFDIMLEKMFQTRDLQTYSPVSGTNYKVGVNDISLIAGSGFIELNFIEGSKTWKVLEYRPNSLPGYDELEDKDDPRKPVVHDDNCDYTFPNDGGGSQGGIVWPVESPRRGPEVRLDKTGPDGNKGNDKPDGGTAAPGFVEDGNAPGPNSDNDDIRYWETTDLITVRTLQLTAEAAIVEVALMEKEVVADYVLYDMAGKLIEKGQIAGMKRFSGFAKGVYVLVVKSSNSTDIRKIRF
jgi:hypothetical protein